jgi:glucosamine-6-phosphate deaminase
VPSGGLDRARRTVEGAVRVVIASDDEEFGRCSAQVLAETVRRRPTATISLTTGRSPAGLFAWLREQVRQGALDLTGVRIVSSEEYAGVGADDPISLFGWLRREVLDPCGVPAAHVLRAAGDAPDLTAECRRFDGALAMLGPLDLVVQSIGVNGHFGFNEPGARPDAPSRVVDLRPSTVAVNAAYWPEGTAVPKRGLAMSVAATLAARHVVLLAMGESKAVALARALHGPIDPQAPCSLLRLARRLTVIADAGAARRLSAADGTLMGEHSRA